MARYTCKYCEDEWTDMVPRTRSDHRLEVCDGCVAIGELALADIRATVAGWLAEDCGPMHEGQDVAEAVHELYQRVLDLLDGKLPKEIKPTETIIEEQDDAR